jgi:hypothetical protein
LLRSRSQGIYYFCLVGGRRVTTLLLTALWVANICMSLFAHIRLEIKRERVEISAEKKSLTKNRADASEFRKTP